MLSLVFVFGCASLSEDEIEVVQDALGVVHYDLLYAVTYAQSEPERGLVVEADGMSQRVTGTLDGGEGWTGKIEVDAELAYEGMASSMEMDLSYRSVEVLGVVLDGDGSQAATTDLSEDGRESTGTYAATGDLEVSGDATGRARYDFLMTYSSSGADFDYEVEGEFAGEEVSPFDVMDILGYGQAMSYD